MEIGSGEGFFLLNPPLNSSMHAYLIKSGGEAGGEGMEGRRKGKEKEGE